jgi:parvulin-like peptidyl-prolyl isomerase
LMNSRSSVFFTATFVLLVFLAGCAKEETSEKKAAEAPAKAAAAVVARVGDHAITTEDFMSYLASRPVSRYAGTVNKEVESRLDARITEEVLYREALRLKLDQDPELNHRIRQMLTQKLIDEEVNRKEWGREIGETELNAYYEKHRDEFNRPAQVRLADIFVAVPSGASKKDKDEKRKKAKQVLSEALKIKGQRAAFGALMNKYSDTPQTHRRGDTGFIDAEGRPAGVDKKLAAAGFTLDPMGSVYSKVVETTDGFHVIMLTGKRPAINRPLASVENQIKQRIRRDNVSAARQAYIDSLKKGTEIQINAEVLAGVAGEVQQAPPQKWPGLKPGAPGPRPPATPPPQKPATQN